MLAAKTNLFVEQHLEAHAVIDQKLKQFADNWLIVEAGLNHLREIVERSIQGRSGNGHA
jgi:hypothetical protein